MPKAKLILFDLVGVLVDSHEFLKNHELCFGSQNKLLDKDRLDLRLALNSFKIGSIDANEFADVVVNIVNLKETKLEFLHKFEALPKSLFAGAESLLDRLRERFILACLSNTNELHWARFMVEMGLCKKLDYKYASYQLGLLKPDVRCFKFVMDDLKILPENIIYFDDKLQNIESANGLGIKAFRVNGVDKIEHHVNQLLNG